MDIIIDLLIQIIRALLKEPDGKKAAAQQSGTPAVASRPTPSTQDPIFDGEGWRRLVTGIGLIVLVSIVAAWIAYMRGWLPTG